MKKFYLLLLVIAMTGSYSHAQIAYSPFVDSIVQQTDHNSILLLTRQLAGDTSVMVNGNLVTITSRHTMNPMNSVAADFIFPAVQLFFQLRAGQNQARSGQHRFENRPFACR